MDVETERRARAAAGVPEGFGDEDVYPDARPCLESLLAVGYVVGIAGNTTAEVEGFLRRAFPAVDVVASSARLGCEKPSGTFFAAIAAAVGLPPRDVVYVGDRIDNDVLPALAAGMFAVHIRRGPWGRVHATWPDAARAHVRIDSLAELPARAAALGG